MARAKAATTDLPTLGQAGSKLAAGLSVLSSLLWIAQAAVVAQALGAQLDHGAVSPLWSASVFAAIGIARAVLGNWSEALAQDAADTVIRSARDRIVRAEARRTDDNPFGGAGAIAALAGEKLEMLGPFLTRFGLARARVMLVPPVILILAFWQSWAVGAVLLVAGPLIPIFMALIGLAAKEASAKQMAEIGTLNDFLVERLSALVDIRLLGADAAVMAGFATQAGDLRSRTMAVLRVAFLSSTVLELFAAIGVAMVAVYVGFSLLGALEFGAWGGPLSPEAGIFLLLLAPEFFQPLRDLAAAWHDKAAADAVLDEVAAHVADAGTPLLGRGAPAQPVPGRPAVVLSGCHTPSGKALPDITIQPGESLAITGASGTGKTTVLRLIAGLIRAEPGTVQVAGQVLGAANADAWRARLGWMPQTPHFLSGSLRANLTLGRSGDLERALTVAAAIDVAQALPRGLNTRLGEVGDGLSGGEARRMTLARAILAAPDLILADEPTADLDPVTAALVTEGLLAEAARGATLVIATHDPALVARMDRVIDLGAAG
ncbi:thiol reductant ABC exporter subunit CydD [Gemmobacter denitrificans]|uniref:Thiol reductant ABC exporter subunit CydD n=1 Tax=Gemmobacter denitrificans TaxID=3123040 RepID=A0ABU8BT81_9RHOB